MRGLLLAALLSPGTASAQGVPTMNEAVCRLLLMEAGLAFGVDAASADVAATPDGGCEAVLVSISALDGAERRVEGVADRLRWRGEGLAGLANGSADFGSLEAEVEGLRIQARTGDDVLDWLLAAQASRREVDGRLAVAWDPETRELRLDELSFDFPGRNAVVLSATLRGVDLASRGAAEASLGSMALAALSAEVTTDGLFEEWLLMPLGDVVLHDLEKPDIPVELTAVQLRDGLVAGARALPPAIFPGDTPEALAALAAELPNPLGTLAVEVDGGEAGLGPARFALTGLPRTPGELWPALGGATLTAAWKPLPPGD